SGRTSGSSRDAPQGERARFLVRFQGDDDPLRMPGCFELWAQLTTRSGVRLSAARVWEGCPSMGENARVEAWGRVEKTSGPGRSAEVLCGPHGAVRQRVKAARDLRVTRARHVDVMAAAGALGPHCVEAGGNHRARRAAPARALVLRDLFA